MNKECLSFFDSIWPYLKVAMESFFYLILINAVYFHMGSNEFKKIEENKKTKWGIFWYICGEIILGYVVCACFYLFEIITLKHWSIFVASAGWHRTFQGMIDYSRTNPNEIKNLAEGKVSLNDLTEKRTA